MRKPMDFEERKKTCARGKESAIWGKDGRKGGVEN